MDLESDVFEISGPTYISMVDWNCSHHRRSIVASLVQGTYLLSQKTRNNYLALAKPWWESFHFKLIQELVDDVDYSTFGAIFQYIPRDDHTQNPSIDIAPRILIAFRGTVIEANTISRDLELDFRIIDNELHKTSRSKMATDIIEKFACNIEVSKIWLAGHSLGATIATIAGENMAKKGFFIETFLFNAPFISTTIGSRKNKEAEDNTRTMNSVVTAMLGVVVKAYQQKPILDDSFDILSSWFPNLYLNPNDPISSEYIGYFEHRKKMEEMGMGIVERLASRSSLGDLLLGALGKEPNPVQCLPSAFLMINTSRSLDYTSAHELRQWWRPDLRLRCERYHHQ